MDQEDNDSELNDWPRTVIIQPTFETTLKDSDYDENDDAIGLEQGMQRDEIEIASWDELEIPDGFELAYEEDRDEYRRWLEVKKAHPTKNKSKNK